MLSYCRCTCILPQIIIGVPILACSRFLCLGNLLLANSIAPRLKVSTDGRSAAGRDLYTGLGSQPNRLPESSVNPTRLTCCPPRRTREKPPPMGAQPPRWPPVLLGDTTTPLAPPSGVRAGARSPARRSGRLSRGALLRPMPPTGSERRETGNGQRPAAPYPTTPSTPRRHWRSARTARAATATPAV